LAYESLAAHDVGRKARHDHGDEKQHSPEQIARKLAVETARSETNL
jgi:hypothetical protein